VTITTRVLAIELIIEPIIEPRRCGVLNQGLPATCALPRSR
jgi:hypothetical protein